MTQPSDRMQVAVNIDLAEASRILSPEQLRALMVGIAQVVAADRSRDTHGSLT